MLSGAAAAESSAASTSAPAFSSKQDLKTAILEAIMKERARKAAKRAAGLPETESSEESDEEAAAAAKVKREAKKAHTAVIDKNDYGVAEYWNQRYMKTKGLFDWYVDLAQLQPLMEAYGQRAFRAIHSTTAGGSEAAPAAFARGSLHLLDVGCGNSGLGEQLYKAGWTHQTHIDISDVIIQRMKEQYADAPEHYGEWLTMDATAMTFPSAHFDLVLEKGTLDALDCTPEEEKVVYGILEECERVLKPGGVMLIITHGGPRRRLPVLQQAKLKWDVETRAIGYSDSALFIRLMRKKLQGKPLASAPPALMAECAAEVRETKRTMELELLRARECIQRVEAEFAARAAGLEVDGDTTEAEQESEVFSPATSSICFVYACVKRPQPT